MTADRPTEKFQSTKTNYWNKKNHKMTQDPQCGLLFYGEKMTVRGHHLMQSTESGPWRHSSLTGSCSATSVSGWASTT
ncbi:hypothetical protein UPYG_G00027920 [Umbra pygmaea]|uniref:Uncharacterized protein n=1 Tax=Umbra pygmaea TaxID=75934 RepID=A0ABD0Y0P7_UMBPY